MRDIVIIGNGESMNGFNYSALCDLPCIVINNGYRRKPDAAYMLFSDDSYYAQHRAPDAAGDFWHFKGEIFSDCALVAADHPRIQRLSDEMLSVKSGKKKFSAADKNTGLKAICFAFAQGYERVALLGFDGRPIPGQMPNQEVYDLYYSHHKEMAKLGLNIVNLSPSSALDMYEFINLSEF